MSDMRANADELRKLINRENTAVVIWDVQHMLVNSIFNKEQFLKSTDYLIEQSRSKGLPLFFTRITPLPDRFESLARKVAFKRSWGDIKPEAFELYFKPKQDETVFYKHTASIFIGTPFELMLNNAGIKNIAFAGIATEIGIESSARDALNRGFLPIVLEDCVSSADKEAHERSIKNMSNLLVVTSSSEFINALS
ncbi:MAG: isochorismatase [Candidatus Micrarchaeota archaeon]|nr:MAG: isochorismatase [Candidatus Micrarchaeota archaeon]